LVLEAAVVDGTARVSNTDVTVVSTAQLRIDKTGAVDADCDGTPETDFTTATLQARPGECILWKVTVVDMGSEPVCNVTVYDAAPPFTRIAGSPQIVAEPAPGGVGACTVTGQEVLCTVGNPMDITGDGAPEPFCLRAGEQAEIRFQVRIE